MMNYIVKNVDVNLIKMEKQKTEFKNIFVLVVDLPFLKLQIR